jgi:hypothetical protein
MKKSMHNGSRTRGGKRTIRRLGAMLALIGLPVAFSMGCDDAIAREFRDAAASSLQTGVTSILNGIVEGVFAVATSSGDPNSTADPNAG